MYMIVLCKKLKYFIFYFSATDVEKEYFLVMIFYVNIIERWNGFWVDSSLIGRKNIKNTWWWRVVVGVVTKFQLPGCVVWYVGKCCL